MGCVFCGRVLVGRPAEVVGGYAGLRGEGGARLGWAGGGWGTPAAGA